MSAIAHVPGAAWATTHRAVSLVLTMALLGIAIVLTVVLVSRDPIAASPSTPDLPSSYDTCAGALPGSAC